ncbi:MAG: glycine oxidase ThiO [Alteromonadaceae bacterium]|nr:glycine oxidase ThiO [Alteromonadaceae bacterium]
MDKINIAIIGSGLMGRLLALYLHRAGYAIELFDKSDKRGTGSAARAAGGLLTPLSESLIAEPEIVNMGLVSLGLWPKILANLDGFTFFQQQGSLIVSHEQDKGEQQRFVRHLNKHWQNSELTTLDRQQLKTLEPELAQRFSSALYLPNEGQLGNRKLLSALTRQLEQEHINWQLGAEVSQVKAHQFCLNGCVKTADLVIDCRGTGAIGELPQLRAVRGELFQLLAPEVNITRPVRLMHPRYNLYIAPKPHHHYVVGATEIESNDSSEMTVRSALELLSAAYSVHSGFAEAKILEQVSACRPAFSDNKPRIKWQAGLLQINGLYRHGFLLAPVLLEHALFVISQQYPRLTDFTLSQYFAGLLTEVT